MQNFLPGRSFAKTGHHNTPEIFTVVPFAQIVSNMGKQKTSAGRMFFLDFIEQAGRAFMEALPKCPVEII